MGDVVEGAEEGARFVQPVRLVGRFLEQLERAVVAEVSERGREGHARMYSRARLVVPCVELDRFLRCNNSLFEAAGGHEAARLLLERLSEHSAVTGEPRLCNCVGSSLLRSGRVTFEPQPAGDHDARACGSHTVGSFRVEHPGLSRLVDAGPVRID